MENNLDLYAPVHIGAHSIFDETYKLTLSHEDATKYIKQVAMENFNIFVNTVEKYIHTQYKDYISEHL